MEATAGVGSRQATEEELRNLRYRENQLTEEIAKSEGTLKEQIIEMAQSMDKRHQLNDPLLPPDFSIAQISTHISRFFRSIGHPFAHWVSEYLPDKYKNPNIHKHRKLLNSLVDIVDASVPPTELKNTSNAGLESALEYQRKCMQINDDLKTLFTNNTWTVRAEALRRGINLLDEVYRDQISARDYRYELPTDGELTTMNEEVIAQGRREIEAKERFLMKYAECPATTLEHATKYANAFRVSANAYESLVEDKWSGDFTFWFDREFHKRIQSAHQAGNSTMFPTTLCERCSENVAEDPKDFHRMKYDKTSPTGFICDNCGGIKVKERENTREQVGDKEPNVYRDAEDLLNHFPNYADIYLDWYKRFKSPEIYSRKTAIHEEFVEGAFGKGKTVVPRKFTQQNDSR